MNGFVRGRNHSGSRFSMVQSSDKGDCRRPLSEYKMEADLKRKCAEAAEAEAATSGGRMKLHLVVLGHVDAGKSTLMGRLLHELG